MASAAAAAGGYSAAPTSEKSLQSLEEFFKRFYGDLPQAPHSSKFKPQDGDWQEFKLSVIQPDLKTKTKSTSKAKAKAKVSPVQPPLAATSSDVTAAAPVVRWASDAVRNAHTAAAAVPAARQNTLPIAILFPGQGSQYPGMLEEVKDIPAVRQMLTSATEILGYDLLALCLNGPEDKLSETRFCQPAMFVAGLAGLEKLRAEREEAVLNFQATAGLSLGEYTALCAAGVFSFEDGLRLVQLRGEAMQEAATKSKQSMLSVAGVSRELLSQLCEQAAKKEGNGAICQIANELFPKGFACAGTAVAIDHLLGLAQTNGALQAKILKTSGGFHTPLMDPAKVKLNKALDEALPRMQPPKHAVFMNVTAQMLAPGTEPATIVALLKQQLTTTVLWETTMRNIVSTGITEFYECGPLKQLSAMMKRTDPTSHKAMKNISV